MKRLIKKSKVDYNLFLIEHILYNIPKPEKEIQQIINENQDCSYNGIGFRVLYLDKVDLNNSFLNLNIEHISNNDIENVVKGLIEVNSKYQSFSKSISGSLEVEQFFGPDMDLDGFPITIETAIFNGLDIEKFVLKYKDTLSEEAIEAYNTFVEQEEIIAKFENHKFNIKYIDRIREFLIEQEGN